MFTLLIPTKNRSEFLNRALNYYANNNFKHLIFIGDSSNSIHADRITKTIKELQERLNIKYQWYPPEVNSAFHGDFAKCFNQMINVVDTPYAAYIGDDDFLVPKSIEKCIDFLDKNEGYIGAHGVGAVIYVEQDRENLKINGNNYRLPPREEETASKRLINHMSNLSNVLFSVYRTHVLQGMFENTELVDISFGGDLLPGCLAVIKGKIKKINHFYVAHMTHKNQNKFYSDIYDWLTSPNWFPSYQMFYKILSDELVKKDAIGLGEAHLIVKRAFWSYLNYKFNSHFRNCYGTIGNAVTSRQKIKRIPGIKGMWNVVKKIRYKIFPSNEVNMHTLLNSRSPYHRDFMPIYRAVVEDL